MKKGLTIFLILITIATNKIFPIDFEQLEDEKLSHADFNCILKDSKGYMWFGGRQGLYKWNGYELKQYMTDPENPNSISGKNISCLYEDSNQNIWIGTSGEGLNVFQPETNDFKKFINNSESPFSISHDWIMCIFEDSKNRLWIGTQNGLNLYEPESESFTYYLTDFINTSNPSFLRRTSITDIAEDSYGNLWITSWMGLHFFNPENTKSLFYHRNIPGNSFKTDRLESIHIDKEDNLWIGARGYLHKVDFEYKYDTAYLDIKDYPLRKDGSAVMVHDVTADKKENLWLATTNGLVYFNRSGNTFSEYTSSPLRSGTISSNLVRSLYLDDNNILWIATTQGGINMYNPNRRKFRDYFPYINDAEDPDLHFVKSIYEDHSGKIWIGTDDGLLKYSPELKLLDKYLHDPANRQGIPQGGITGIVEDSLNRLWISNWGGGLSLFDREKDDFIHFKFDEENFDPEKMPGSNAILCLEKDYKGNLWMGTGNGYLEKFNPYEKQFRPYFLFDEDSLRGIPVVGITAEANGTIWAAANPKGGVFRISNTGNISRYSFKNAEEKGLTTNEVYSVEIDQTGKLWLGTDVGLFVYQRKKDRFEKISGDENLPDMPVFNIIADVQNSLWLSTPFNLIKYDERDSSVVIYDDSDGVRTASTTGIITHDNRIYLGGVNGITRFHPENIAYNDDVPPVVLTDFLIRNELVDIHTPGSPLTKALDVVDTIILDYDQSYFSFQFAALNYTQPERNRYAYKLEGFDDSWNYVETRRKAYYTNVPPGKYIFNVIGSNNNGIWNRDGASVLVIIKPPWYKTIWAYILYAGIFIAAIIGIIYITKMREKLKNKIMLQQMEMEQQKVLARKEAEVAEYKLRFFTNISHEFRTPLTLIKGPLEKLNKAGSSFEKEAKELLPIVYRNSQRLMILIEQLLTFRKINQSQQSLKAGEQDLVELTKSILKFYETAANDKELKVNQNYSKNQIIAWFDPFKMEQIIHNLFSNAFKYASVRGQFEIKIDIIDHINEFNDLNPGSWVEIKVFNTTEYIQPENLKKLFERFYQIDGKESGSGIGLSIAKTLVELHHGKIQVNYLNERKGIEFTIYIPGDDRYLSENEKVSKPGYFHWKQLNFEQTLPVLEKKEASTSEVLRKKDYEILLVEDNKDLRDFMVKSLSKSYTVYDAENGEKGLEIAGERIPDVIISDVIMPVMDGYEMVEKIKTDQKTCHIPVILLTARTTDEDKISGYGSGSDAYVEKPFNLEVLEAQVKQMIKNREIMQRNFREWVHKNKNPENLPSEDQVFLKKVNSIIEENIDSGDMGVQVLAEAVSLSTTQIYRKIKAVTGKTPVEYIRMYKFSRAQKLLAETDYSIKQIAYMSGFNDPSYFGKCFKNEFGISPQKYRNTYMNYQLEE